MNRSIVTIGVAAWLAGSAVIVTNYAHAQAADATGVRQLLAAAPAPPVWFTDLWPHADPNLKQYACEAHAAGQDATVVFRINDTLDGNRFQKPQETELVTVAQIAPFLEEHCS